MSLAFENAIAVLFADPNIGLEAIYTSDGGAPVVVRAVVRRPDEVTSFGDARLWSETTRIDLRVAEVPIPRPGDRIEIGGGAVALAQAGEVFGEGDVEHPVEAVLDRPVFADGLRGGLGGERPR